MGSNGEDDATYIEGGYIKVVRGERRITNCWEKSRFFLSASHVSFLSISLFLFYLFFLCTSFVLSLLLHFAFTALLWRL